MSTQTLLFAELAPDPLLGFPEPLSERYRPQRIADFAGLTEAKKVLAGFAARPTVERAQELKLNRRRYVANCRKSLKAQRRINQYM